LLIEQSLHRAQFESQGFAVGQAGRFEEGNEHLVLVEEAPGGSTFCVVLQEIVPKYEDPGRGPGLGGLQATALVQHAQDFQVGGEVGANALIVIGIEMQAKKRVVQEFKHMFDFAAAAQTIAEIELVLGLASDIGVDSRADFLKEGPELLKNPFAICRAIRIAALPVVLH